MICPSDCGMYYPDKRIGQSGTAYERCFHGEVGLNVPGREGLIPGILESAVRMVMECVSLSP